MIEYDCLFSVGVVSALGQEYQEAKVFLRLDITMNTTQLSSIWFFALCIMNYLVASFHVLLNILSHPPPFGSSQGTFPIVSVIFKEIHLY